MIKLVDLLLELPRKIDNPKTIPELMDKVLSMPTLNRKEMISATSKLNEEGIYFWYLSPEGAKRWEEVLTKLSGKPQTVDYCQVNKEGNYLVYVGVAGNPKREGKPTGLKMRFIQHIGKSNLEASTTREKIFKILFPDVDTTDKFQMQKKNIKKGGGKYYTEFRPEYDKFIDENFRFNFIKATDLDLDKNLPIKAAVEKIEMQFIHSCVLHLNSKGVPEDFVKYTSSGKLYPNK